MEEKPQELIEQVITRLWKSSCSDSNPKGKSVGLVQLTADDSFPVFLATEDLRDSSKVKSFSSLVSFDELAKKLKKSLEEEQEDPVEEEWIRAFNESFEKLQAKLNESINKTRNRIFRLLFKNKMTSEFLRQFEEGSLNNDEEFLKASQELIRKISIQRSPSGVSAIVKDIQRQSGEVCSGIEMALERLKEGTEELFRGGPLEVPCLVSSKRNFPSRIVPRKEGLCFFSGVLSNCFAFPKFELLFRASRDGFKADKFHSMCDRKGPTLTIVRTTTGYIFGGFAMKSWESPQKDRWEADKNSFLFSWDWREIYRQFQNEDKALEFDKNYGPIFGAGRDLIIYEESNKNSESRMNINSTYSSEGRERDAISGSDYFTISDYEVLLVSK